MGHYRFFGVVIIGTLEGILTAVIISLLDIIVHGSHPPVYEMGRKPGADVFRPLSDHAHYETVPGLLIIRVEGRLFFANASRIRERVWARIQEVQPRVIVIDCSAIIDIEYTGLRTLIEFEEQLQDDGITLWLAAPNISSLAI